MRILVTNDDSHRSPLLEFLLNYLNERSDVTFVVPAHEQSWKGKSITRFEPLHVQRMKLFGVDGWAVDGTPADCVNAALYNLLSEKPDLVISGINAGMNAGISFIFSSGTVGACFEANIAGVPALALSQQFDEAVHRHYVAEYALPHNEVDRLRKQTEKTLELVFQRLLHPLLECDEAITWNVNFPFHLGESEALYRALPGQTFYHRLFEGSEARLEHNLTECSIDERPGSDSQLLRNGRIAVTPLDIRCFGQKVSHSAELVADTVLEKIP